MKAASRRLVVAIALAVATATLFTGVIGVAHAADGDRLPDSLVLPPVRIGDQGAYVNQTDQGETSFVWTREMVRDENTSLMEADILQVHAGEAGFSYRVDWAFPAGENTTAYLELDGRGAGSMTIRPVPLVPVDTEYEVEGGVWYRGYTPSPAPCPYWMKIQGTSVPLDRPVDLGCHGVNETFQASVVEMVEGVRTVRFDDTTNGTERLWFAPGIPVPVAFESRVENETHRHVLRSFVQGDQDRTLGDAPVSGPSPGESTTEPWLVDDSDLDLMLPIGTAFTAARDNLIDPSVRDFLEQHSDAVIPYARSWQMDSPQGPSVGWWFTLADEAEALSISIQREYPPGADQLPPDAANLLGRDTLTTQVADPQPLPTRQAWPRLSHLDQRFSLLVDGDWQEWGYSFEEDEGSIWMGASGLTQEVIPSENGTVTLSLGGVANEIRFDEQGRIQYAYDSSGSVSQTTAPLGAPSGSAPADRSPGVAPGSVWPTPWEAAATGSVALLVGILYWLWPVLKSGPLAGLFSRLDRPQMLEHPARAAILASVREEPGLHFSALRRATELPNGTLRHHVRQLVQRDILLERQAGGYTCYFVARGTDVRDIHVAPLLKSEGARTVLEAVRRCPGITAREIADTHGFSPGTVAYHVGRFVDAGAVHSRRDGRQVLLFAGDAGAA